MTQPNSNVGHLTDIPNATLVAWHTAQDVQAVRTVAGDELLYVNGKRVPLHPRMHGAVQQVINHCNTKNAVEVLVAQLATAFESLH